MFCKGINSRKEKYQSCYSLFPIQHPDIHYPENILCQYMYSKSVHVL